MPKAVKALCEVGYKKAYYSQANEGIYFSPNKELVQSKYGKNGGTLIEASINPKNSLDLGTADAMYFDGRKVNYGDVVNENVKRELQGLKPVPEPDIILTGISKKAKSWLQKNGYDAVEGMKGEMWSAPELVALDKSIIKTKSPDLYNKAQGGVGGYVDKAGNPVSVTQATAKEINESLVGAGKSPLFKEDLPTVVARMGISTGRKQAGVEFLEATKGLEGKAKELANETYEKMTNVESIAKAIKYFDNVQNLWKAQVLVAPSYHIRNEVGNLWNNFLANVGPDSYVKSTALQTRMARGTLSKADEALVETMKKEGVIGTGQYGGDITQTIADEIGGASWNPVSQRFGLYKGNRAIGSAIEDNAKIAHYLQKIDDGFTPKASAESVKKYLFDYSDLTWGEQNILKRVMPFYTWTRKNVPLQIEQFFNQPGKFSNVGTAQRNIESGVETPDERYLNDYIKSNTPMRWSTNDSFLVL